MHRRTALKAKQGRVQWKNRWTRPMNTVGPIGVAIERVQPGNGFRHAVTQDEVYSFVQNLVDWPRLSVGLDRIMLAEGWPDHYGFYRQGTIGLRAFSSDLTVTYDADQRSKDRDFFERLAVDIEPVVASEDDSTVSHVICHLSRPVARAFMLVHVLSHELGHHLDRIENEWRDCPHGEPFAYRYGFQQADRFWQTYLRVFGDPRKER